MVKRGDAGRGKLVMENRPVGVKSPAGGPPRTSIFVTRVMRVACLFAALILIGTPFSTLADAHPIHTTMAELRVVSTPAGPVIQLSVRGFIDDVSAAVARSEKRTAPRDSSLSDSSASRYLRARVTIADAHGRAIALQWCGVHRVREIVWMCVRSAPGTDARGLRMTNQLLTEFHPDQVNLVQATIGDQRASALFMKGDGEKQIR